VKKVLTIAGSDSSGGAGLQADLKTFAASGVYGLSVVTGVTAQNTLGVTGVHPIPPDFVGKQIEAVFDDIEIDAVKTGMLSNTAIIQEVCEKLARFSVPQLVIDPVMVATSGDLLMDERIDKVLWTFRNLLIPMATVLTPNIPETEILTGREIESIDDMKAAAIDLQSLGARNVVIKGGHLNNEGVVVDILFDGNGFFEYSDRRVKTRNTHGTGCTFAAALAAGLAKGLTVHEAVGEAKRYIRVALENSYSVGRGGGPPNHFGELFRMAEGCSGKGQE
jgi:hydroxymethylpyrimidine/phosphomethylpyrimidine kinase